MENLPSSDTQKLLLNKAFALDDSTSVYGLLHRIGRAFAMSVLYRRIWATSLPSRPKWKRVFETTSQDESGVSTAVT